MTNLRVKAILLLPVIRFSSATTTRCILPVSPWVNGKTEFISSDLIKNISLRLTKSNY